MSIEQRAREIAAMYNPEPTDWDAKLVQFGIIEGLEMADQKLKVLMLGLPVNGLKAEALLEASAAIHALIGEKR